MTIAPEMIPEKAVEAAAKAFRETWGVNAADRFSAAIAAALNGWEGAEVRAVDGFWGVLHLPLTQEKQNG